MTNGIATNISFAQMDCFGVEDELGVSWAYHYGNGSGKELDCEIYHFLNSSECF